MQETVTRKNLKWSNRERALLLEYVTNRIVQGEAIGKSLETFAALYNIPVSRVKAQWQVVSEADKFKVILAKREWQTHVKPERLRIEKAKKREEKLIALSRKKREEYRKVKKHKKERVIIPTNKAVRHQDKGLLITVDAHGIVQTVKAH